MKIAAAAAVVGGSAQAALGVAKARGRRNGMITGSGRGT